MAIAEPGLAPARPPRWPILVAGVGSGGAAILIATLALKWQVALLAALAMAGVLFVVPDRQALFLAIVVVSMQVTLHKAFSRLAGDNSAGMVALYMTTVDAGVLLLYLAWFWTGDLFRKLPALLRHPIALCAYLAILGELLSVLNAVDRERVLWGVARDGWMVLLFWYVAGNLHGRRASLYVVWALFLTIVGQGTLVAAQFVTKRPILAQLLAERQSTTLEIKDVVLNSATQQLFRPSGTSVHPDFLASFLLPAVLVACAIAIAGRERRLQTVATAIFAIGAVALSLTLARAALVGFGVALLAILALLAWRGLASRRRLQRAILVGLTLLAIAAIPVARKMLTNFHALGQELDARGELMGVAWHMFLVHPFVGIGASNFVEVMHNYSDVRLIFDGNPVHSFYLLLLSETGILGVASWIAFAVATIWVGLRATRQRDPLLATIAVALVASLVGLYVEETITFSLREDAPLEMYWLVIGWLAALAGPVPRPGIAAARKGHVDAG